VTAKKKPLKTFTNKEDGMESYVFENEGREGGYNVTMKDLDADEFVPTGFVGIKDLNKAIEKAKKIVRVSSRDDIQLIKRVAERFAADQAPTADQFRDMVTKAIKRVGDGVRALGLGSVVKYNPQERIDTDRHGGIHGTFFLRIDHPQVNPSWRPGIFFYWDTGKNQGSVSASNLVWGRKEVENLPLNRMDDAMRAIADAIVKDLKRQLGQQDSKEVWSVVTVGKDHGYASEVDVFDSKAKAEAEARKRGNCYVVKGTQMWNEPLGQVEEQSKPAPYKFFR